MRNFRSLVLGLVLVILSPLSWGEDVYYCVEEQRVGIAATGSGDAYELNQYVEEKFTLKYEISQSRLAIKGKAFGGDENFYMDCDYCSGRKPVFHGKTEYAHFLLNGGRFFFTSAGFDSARMTTGTCTKF